MLKESPRKTLTDIYEFITNIIGFPLMKTILRIEVLFNKRVPTRFVTGASYRHLTWGRWKGRKPISFHTFNHHAFLIFLYFRKGNIGINHWLLLAEYYTFSFLFFAMPA